jgi:hypothetical protein
VASATAADAEWSFLHSGPYGVPAPISTISQASVLEPHSAKASTNSLFFISSTPGRTAGA